MELSENLKNFIQKQDWIFAKTYAETWPHEYIVQERVNSLLPILNVFYSSPPSTHYDTRYL